MTKRAIVVGSGAGGSTVAKELAGDYAVTVLEAGRAFRPFALDLALPKRVRQAGLVLDPRMIGLLFPVMDVRRASGGLILVRGIGLGGSTTICTGNAMRVDGSLRDIGIDLDPEFAELYQEIPVTAAHQRLWRPATRELFGACQNMGLEPYATPKMGDYGRCTDCGRCMLGCQHGVKWDSRRFLDIAVAKGAKVETGVAVTKVLIDNGLVTGVQARQGLRTMRYPADLVVLAAGGLGTPAILRNSGLSCTDTLFVDPVLTVAAEWPDSRQDTELPMPFVVERDGYIVSPYFDYLSFAVDRSWRRPARHILGLMIKLADASHGSVTGSQIHKTLTAADHARMREAVGLCTEILGRIGVAKDRAFLGTLNGGHPGGMLPLGVDEAETMHHHHLPPNLYVADASLFPRSLGSPPILTIMALAKRISSICRLAARG